MKVSTSLIFILVVSGQYGCALTAAEPSGQITIPVAEVSQSGFDEIRHAIMNGAVMEATLTSEGKLTIIRNNIITESYLEYNLGN